MFDACLASAAARAVARESLQILKGLGLVRGHQMLDHLVRYALALADDLCNRLLVRIVQTVLLKIIIDCCPQGLVAQNRAVELVLRKSAKLVRDHIRCDVIGFLQCHSLDHFAHHGSAGDCACAAVCEPSDVIDPVISHLDAHAHLVAAGKGTDFTHCIGRPVLVLVPDVPGIHEMILNRIRIYPLGHETVHIILPCRNRP